MCKPGAMIVRDGRVLVASSGKLAVCREDGTCPECCGDGNPTGPCTCSPLVHADRTCGVLDTTSGLTAWRVTIEGEASYSNLAINHGSGVTLSDVAYQTRAFSFERLYLAGEADECGGDYEFPASGDPSTVVFDQSATGVGAEGDFELYVGGGASSTTSSGGSPKGWALSGSQLATWARQGPDTYTAPDGPVLLLTQLNDTAAGLLNIRAAGGSFRDMKDHVMGVWSAATEESIGQLYVGGQKSPADLGANYPYSFSSSHSGSVTLARTACRYTLTRVVAAQFAGRTALPGGTEEEAELAAEYRIVARLVECTEALAMMRERRADPRAVEAAEQVMRRCRGCGDQGLA